MSRTWWLPLIVVLAGCRPASQWSIEATATAAETSEHSSSTGSIDNQSLIVQGKTLPTPGRISEIAATVMHPVEHVLVKPGDMVHEGQPLIEIDSDEPQADVRAKHAEVKELTSALAKLKAMPRAEERAQARAELDSAQVACKAAHAYLERLATLREHDAVSAREYLVQKTVVLRAEADERAAQAHLDYLLKLPIEHEIAEAEAQLAVAQAGLEAAEFELEHYTLHAVIDGVICWLDVTPGTVSRAGTKVWGEIVDLREVDVKVELSPQQLSRIDLSQPVQVHQAELSKSWPAKFVYTAPAANRENGCIPVILRVTNAGEPLRCHLNVSVRFRLAAASGAAETPTRASLAVQPIPAK